MDGWIVVAWVGGQGRYEAVVEDKVDGEAIDDHGQL
jgi:hypothetical protein